MSNEVAVRQDSQVSAETMEKVIAEGDLSKLTPKQRVEYYMSVCDSLGLNWRTRPFDYISLKGKLTLYTKKDATEQLRKAQSVSVPTLEHDLMGDIYVVTAHAVMPSGRTDASTGAVFIGGLKGEDLANAFMKAETKAKRRVTLSICGLGWTDESEIEGIPNAKPARVDLETGEIVDAKPTVTVVTPEANAWTRTAGQLEKMAEHYALTNATILEALGVKALTEYAGSKADAKDAIEQWLSENVTEIEPEPEQLTM